LLYQLIQDLIFDKQRLE